jgi:hypothetical protein
MLNPGLKNLGDFEITTAGMQTGDWVDDLDGMLACLASVRLSYGSGGASIKAYLQSTPDDGTTVHDIACVVFGVASEHALLNFSALTPKLSQVTPSDGALADDTAVDGLLGTKLRLKLVSVGTYAGSTVLSGRLTVR